MTEQDLDVFPLLGEEATSADPHNSPVKNSRFEVGASRLKGRWTFLLELNLSMYIVSNIMTFPISQFYVYNQVAKSHGIPNYIHDDNSDVCHNKNSSNGTDVITRIQQESSNQLMYMSFLSSILATLPTFVLGYISDRYGRKITFLITLVGLLMHEIVYIIVFYLEAPLFYLYIGSILEGITGYIAGAYMMGFIIIADITSPGKERGFRIAVMEGVLATAAALGVLVVGFWIKSSGFLVPMLCSTGLCIANIIVWIVCVPETRPFAVDKSKLALNFTTMKKCFEFYYKSLPAKRRGNMSALLSILILTSTALWSIGNVIVLFLLNRPFCWTELHISLFSSTQIIVNWAIGILLLGFLQRLMQDVGMLTLGCFIGMISLVPLALASQDWMVYLYMLLSTVSVIIIPISRSVLSKMCSPEEQGSLFAGVAAVEHLVTGSGLLMFGEIYKLSIGFYPGLVFLITAGLMLIGLVLCRCLYLWKSPTPESDTELEVEEKRYVA